MSDVINDNIKNDHTTDNNEKDDSIQHQECIDTNSINNEIHMYKQARGRRSDTIISGLQFKTKDEAKAFILNIKKKFGIGGCQKMMEDMDKDFPVFVFTGDLRDKIIKILVESYKYDPKLIKKHG
jgi:translation initiation factor 1 (eIF-1/SUI1)